MTLQSALTFGLFAAVAVVYAAAAPPARAAAKKDQPNWDSLIAHEVPQWLLDAKFGIYAHWGVYSVPAYGNEWYARRMYDKANPVHRHHVKTYGDPAKFGYKDLVPKFRAEKFDPDAWADLIRKSGARYAGIAVVHHDGFGLWSSDVNRWNAGKMGPKRDLYGDLVKSLRKRDLKIIATFHHIRTFNWYLPPSGKAREAAKKAGWDLFDPEYADLYWNEYTGKYEDFIAQWKAKVKEVTDKYRPDVLWFDGGKFQDPASRHHVLEILSYYLNRSVEWGKGVEVLNKLPVSMRFNFPRKFGMLTFEEGRDRGEKVDRPWVDDMKIGDRSWGYVVGMKYRPAGEIIDGLIDRTARGGGLLLSLSPKADGTIPAGQRKVLLEMGKWLETNGEAIFGTRPWKVHAEGPVSKLRRGRRKHTKWVFDNCSAEDIRFTCRGDKLYAIALGWPEGPTLTIKTLAAGAGVPGGRIASVTLLGCREKIKWSRTSGGLVLTLPAGKPHDYAYAFRIKVAGPGDVRK